MSTHSKQGIPNNSSHKPKVGQKLWLLKWELDEGIVTKHPITKEPDFVENPMLKDSWHVYHVTRLEAIDVALQKLHEMRDAELRRSLTCLN